MAARTAKALAVFVSLLPACVHAPFRDWCPSWGRAEPVQASCLKRPPTSDYMDAIAAEIGRETRDLAPLGHSGHAEFRFALQESGEVDYRCFVRSSDRELAATIANAFDRAAPFPAIPHHASCLAGRELFRHIHVGLAR